MPARSQSFPVLLSLFELAVLAVFFSLFVSAVRSERQSARVAARDKEIANLTRERDALARDLKAEQAVLSDTLANLLELLDRLSAVNGQLRESESQAADLKRRIKALTSERDALARTHSEVKAELSEALAKLRKLVEQLSDASRQQQEAEIQKADLRRRLRDTDARFAELEARLKAHPPVAKAVLGLRGELGRVAILFDCSGSMATGDRWQQARTVVQTWVNHLDIGECALITFSSSAEIVRVGGSDFLELRGPSGRKNRTLLAEHLSHLTPAGGTNTLAALELAYGLKGVQTIIVFTDGAPNDGHSDRFDPVIADRIYKLCRERKDVPVNTVGLGHYFEERLASFLIRLAEETGGTFIGR